MTFLCRLRSPLQHTPLSYFYVSVTATIPMLGSSKGIGSERRRYTKKSHVCRGKFWNSALQTTGSRCLPKVYTPQDRSQNGREAQIWQLTCTEFYPKKLQGWNNLPLLHRQRRCSAPQFFCAFLANGHSKFCASTMHLWFQSLLRAAVPKYQSLFPSYSLT